jgi:hypothetical protein
MKQKKFPCPVCKGKGGEIEPVLDDGSGPYYSCGFCNDECFITVDSELHWILRRDRIMNFILNNIGREDIDNEYCDAIYKRVEQIIEVSKKIPETEKQSKSIGIEDIPF